MRKRLLCATAAGAVMALVLNGQAVSAPVAEPVQPDPALAFLADPGQVDWAEVRRNRAEKAGQRARLREAKAAARVYAEVEPAGAQGANDTPAAAEFVAGFGTRKDPRVALTGELAAGGAGDRDFFAVDLRAGDVLGASVAGGASRLVVHDAAGREVFGSSQDFTAIYSPDSPLPGGGNAVVDFVAPSEGRYTVGVENGEGRYDVTVEAYRPGTETDPWGTVQTLFLDFDGARVNTGIYGGPGVRQLSPLSAFVAGWGLTAADEDALIDQVVATVRENMEHDLAVKGTNRRFAVRILNSRDHADLFGRPDVSRVVVGGTIAESGVNTVGIAQSIDPGNFGHEETALVLLDRLSAPAGPSVSLNTYITPASDRTAFVGRAIGNVVAHEAGHMSGSWHLDQFNDVPSLMDQGGNPKVMFAVGPDGVGGTADDIDLDFTEDVLNPSEGFTGVEDTLNRTAWAYVRGRG